MEKSEYVDQTLKSARIYWLVSLLWTTGFLVLDLRWHSPRIFACVDAREHLV